MRFSPPDNLRSSSRRKTQETWVSLFVCVGHGVGSSLRIQFPGPSVLRGSSRNDGACNARERVEIGRENSVRSDVVKIEEGGSSIRESEKFDKMIKDGFMRCGAVSELRGIALNPAEDRRVHRHLDIKMRLLRNVKGFSDNWTTATLSRQWGPSQSGGANSHPIPTATNSEEAYVCGWNPGLSDTKRKSTAWRRISSGGGRGMSEGTSDVSELIEFSKCEDDICFEIDKQPSLKRAIFSFRKRLVLPS